MYSQKVIKIEISELEALRDLSFVYAELASQRMKRTRDQVLKARLFLDNLNVLFQEILISYAAEVRELNKKRKGKKPITFLSHNGKTVAVFLSANVGLYGTIMAQTYKMFLDEVKQKNVEVTLIGKQGLSLFLLDTQDIPYTYFDMPDSGSVGTFLQPIIKHIVKYQEIHLFYGSYQTVISQKPTRLVISSHQQFDEKKHQNRKHFYFEPEVPTILAFFETEIFTSLFEQAVNESRLAKYASRIIAMDQANEYIKKQIKLLHFENNRLSHALLNRKQLNGLPAVYFQKEKAWYE